MTVITHSARVTGPIPYVSGSGAAVSIPPGPCVIEQLEGQLVDVIWGEEGTESAVLPSKDMEAAVLRGDLVWLD